MIIEVKKDRKKEVLVIFQKTGFSLSFFLLENCLINVALVKRCFVRLLI